MPQLALISFDVEQFDIPTEYGIAIDEDEQFRIGRAGLLSVLDLLDKRQTRCTFFITAQFAQRFPEDIRRLAKSKLNHEIASHGLTHGDLLPGHLEESRRILSEISGREVIGFRRARMADTDPAAIAGAGYVYNASENPIWLPGRYNHFFSPREARTVKTERGPLVQIPASATPRIRVPLFWLAFKNLPMPVIRAASRWCLWSDGALNTYFHPWEFTQISTYGLPRVVKMMDGRELLDRLEGYLVWLGARAEFATYGDYARRIAERGGIT